MSVLLAVLFAAGVGLIWASAVCHLQLTLPRPTLALPLPAWAAVTTTGVLVGGLVGWLLGHLPVLALAGAAAGGYLPQAWGRRQRERQQHERERAWPAALTQLADAMEAGLAFPAAIAHVANNGPTALRPDLTAFHTRLRSQGLAAALDRLTNANERTADSVALFLRAGLLDLPTGGLAPILRDLARVLDDRLEARQKARSRAATLNLEATILALSPIVLLLLIGSASPGYLDAYRTPTGTAVAAVGGLLIFGCYLLMRRLGRIPEPRRTHHMNRTST